MRSRSVHVLPMVLACAAATPALAQAPVETMPPVVVTATGVATPAERVASSVTVIDRQSLARHQYRRVHEALAAVPGVRVAPSGGAGQQTSVFIRGANSNHTLVLLDGVELNDPSNPNGAFDFAHLPVNNVERIEVVRGPHSTLYGSSAIGGVVNIITRRGRGPARVDYEMEAGSDDTWNQSLGVAGSAGPVHYAAGLAHLDTAGDSVTPARLRAGARAEDDGSEQWSGSLRAGVAAGDALEFNLFARQEYADTERDVLAEDPDIRLTERRQAVRGEVLGWLADGRWETRLAVSRTGFSRRDRDRRQDPLGDQGRTDIRGATLTYDWVNHLYLAPGHVVTLGVETRKESFTSAGRLVFGSPFGDFVITQDSDAEARSNALYGQYHVARGERFDAVLGLRVDAHEDFSAETTVRFAPVWRVPDLDLRLFGSIGTAFKAPSLFELHGFSPNNFGTAYRGNPDLEPERSMALDLGFERAVGPWRYGATWFRSRVEGLIETVFLPTFDSTSANVEEAEVQGAELFLAGPMGPRVQWRVDYTFTDAVDGAGDRLLRRPRHQADLDLAWRPAPRVEASVRAQYLGGVTDLDPDGTRVEPGGYPLVHLAGSYALGKDTRLFARVTNLLDRAHEPVRGFAGPDRGIYLGLGGRF